MAFGTGDLSNSILVPAGDVARALGWTLTRTKRWLSKEGIARKQRCGRNGRWYTTRALIRSAFPEAADDIIARLTD